MAAVTANTRLTWPRRVGYAGHSCHSDGLGRHTPEAGPPVERLAGSPFVNEPTDVEMLSWTDASLSVASLLSGPGLDGQSEPCGLGP